MMKLTMPALGTWLAIGGAACSGGAEEVRSVETSFSGVRVEAIDADERLFLANGVVVSGDARLVTAVRDGEGIEVFVQETHPPRYVVHFADGSRRRYRSVAGPPRE